MCWTNWRVRCILRCLLFTKTKQTSGHMPHGRHSASLKLHKQKRDDIRIRISSIFHFLSLYILRRKAKIRTRPQREQRSDFSLLVRQKGFEPPNFWFVAVRDFCILCKRCRKLMVMNEKVGGFLRSCAAPASTVIYCKQYMLAVLLAAAHKSIWLFVSRFLIVGSARRGWRSSFYSLDYIARRVCPQVK